MFRVTIPEKFWREGGSAADSKKILPGNYVLTYNVPEFIQFEIIRDALNTFAGQYKDEKNIRYHFVGADFNQSNLELQIRVEYLDLGGVLQGQNQASYITALRVTVGILGALIIAYSLTKVERIVTEAELAVTLGAGAFFLSQATPLIKIFKG